MLSEMLSFFIIYVILFCKLSFTVFFMIWKSKTKCFLFKLYNAIQQEWSSNTKSVKSNFKVQFDKIYCILNHIPQKYLISTPYIDKLKYF